MSTDVSKNPGANSSLPKFRNRDNAETLVCRAFAALGVLAGVDVDRGIGPSDLDVALTEAAYQSNFDDPHFLGGPCCFHYVETAGDVDELAAKARAVTDGFDRYIREHCDEKAQQEASEHIALINGGIAWLRKTRRSP